MSTLVLTIGPEYKGSLYLYKNAEKSADLFESMIKKKCDATFLKLRGQNASSDKIISTLSSFSKYTEDDYKRIIIYYSGHGDRSAGKEFWKTSNGNVDQVRLAKIINTIKPIVIVFSDSCSSEHMVNKHFCTHSFISIGATKDHQDAMMTGDGGLFTLQLEKAFDELSNNFTIRELLSKIDTYRIEVQSYSYMMFNLSLNDEMFFHSDEHNISLKSDENLK